MSTSDSWGVNRHTTWCISPVSVVLQLWLVSGWGLQETEISIALLTYEVWEELYLNMLKSCWTDSTVTDKAVVNLLCVMCIRTKRQSLVCVWRAWWSRRRRHTTAAARSTSRTRTQSTNSSQRRTRRCSVPTGRRSTATTRLWVNRSATSRASWRPRELMPLTRWTEHSATLRLLFFFFFCGRHH